MKVDRSLKGLPFDTMCTVQLQVQGANEHLMYTAPITPQRKKQGAKGLFRILLTTLNIH